MTKLNKFFKSTNGKVSKDIFSKEHAGPNSPQYKAYIAGLGACENTDQLLTFLLSNPPLKNPHAISFLATTLVRLRVEFTLVEQLVTTYNTDFRGPVDTTRELVSIHLEDIYKAADATEEYRRNTPTLPITPAPVLYCQTRAASSPTTLPRPHSTTPRTKPKDTPPPSTDFGLPQCHRPREKTVWDHAPSAVRQAPAPSPKLTPLTVLPVQLHGSLASNPDRIQRPSSPKVKKHPKRTKPATKKPRFQSSTSSASPAQASTFNALRVERCKQPRQPTTTDTHTPTRAPARRKPKTIDPKLIAADIIREKVEHAGLPPQTSLASQDTVTAQICQLFSEYPIRVDNAHTVTVFIAEHINIGDRYPNGATYLLSYFWNQEQDIFLDLERLTSILEMYFSSSSPAQGKRSQPPV